jgi:O-antigen ligase
MRYIAIAVILLSYPGLVFWIREFPRDRHWAYFGLGLLPFTVNHWNLDAALINWATWPGYTKGAVITLLDTLALAIITTHRSPRGIPPLTGFIIFYLLAALLSVAMSGVPLGSAFYSFQLMRILILMVAVAKIANDSRAFKWMAWGLAAGISYQAVFTIEQKLNGAAQAAGTMGHQNLLGLMTHSATFPLLAILLAGIRSRILAIGVVSSLIVVALGASRAAIGFTALGLALLLALSLIRSRTAYKRRIVGLAIMALVVISPLMVIAIHNRMGQPGAEQSNDSERAAFERAAKAIWADHPMGIGANQYVVVANTQGYSTRAGVGWTQGSRAANVHNAYLLTAVETGWIGLLTMLAMMVSVIFTGLRFAFQDRRDPRGDIALGCAVAVLMTAVHNFYEWIFVTYQAQYVFAIMVGIISGLVRGRALEHRQGLRMARTGTGGFMDAPAMEPPTPIAKESSGIAGNHPATDEAQFNG